MTNTENRQRRLKYRQIDSQIDREIDRVPEEEKKKKGTEQTLKTIEENFPEIKKNLKLHIQRSYFKAENIVPK